MARVVKTPKSRNVCIRLHSDKGGPLGDIVLVPGGLRAYLWIGPSDEERRPGTVYTVSGAKALRALAKAVLKEVGRG